MDQRAFLSRSETFGFDTPQPWSVAALRLLFCVPRAFAPLVEAWDDRHPGTLAALERLTEAGFVAYQPAIVVDTRTGQLAAASSRRVPRYRATARGRQLLTEAVEDIRVLEDMFPRTADRNYPGLLALLGTFCLDDAEAKFGLSASHAGQRAKVALAGRHALPPRTVRWWVRRLRTTGHLRELDVRLADVREVIPAHWRVTRRLSRQLSDALAAFSDEASLWKVEFRLARSRYLGDIDPARVRVSGAADYEHDIECQRILAALLGSPRCAPDGIFAVEPRITLPVQRSTVPFTIGAAAPGRSSRLADRPGGSPVGTAAATAGTAGTAGAGGPGGVGDLLFYQPDAELRESDESGVRRSVLEYERSQSRRDAWSHIERFLGYLHNRTLPMESAVLRFVVDSRARERAYVELTEAFADYALRHPERMPANPVTLAVSSSARVLQAEDPLDPRAWFRVSLATSAGADTHRRTVLHPADDSPYEEYFARA